MVLYGSKGDSGERKLDSSKNDFERAQVGTWLGTLLVQKRAGPCREMLLADGGLVMGLGMGCNWFWHV